jgi:hypothetical protein
MTYKLTATMEENLPKSERRFDSLQSKRIITVSQPVEINYNVHQSQSKEINKMLLMAAGNVKVEAELERDAFQPTELVVVKVTIDNLECKEALKKMKFELYREMFINKKGYGSQEKKNAIKKEDLRNSSQ